MSWWSMIPKRTKVSGIRRMMSGGYRHALLIVAVFIPYSVAVEEMLSIKAMDLFFPCMCLEMIFVIYFYTLPTVGCLQ